MGNGAGGGGNWSQRAAFRMNGGGGRPPRAYAGSGAGPKDSMVKCYTIREGRYMGLNRTEGGCLHVYKQSEYVMEARMCRRS